MAGGGQNDPDEQLYDPPPVYHGKYRGKVESNLDPFMLGRLMVQVPAVPGSLLNWALPCTPYAGPGVGFYFIPPVGASVWVEFEGGNPMRPIWSGCFWAEGEMPGEPPDPLVKLIRTSGIQLSLSELPEIGGVKLEVGPPVVDIPMTLVFNSAGVTLTVVDAVVKVTPEAIIGTTAETVVTVTPETVSVLIEPTSIEITAEGITAEAGLFKIQSLEVISQDSSLLITVTYVDTTSGASETLTLERPQ